MNSQMIIKPIIITGCQRSGTTLLRTLLGNHSNLIEHPQEPQFIIELYQRFGMQISDVPTAVSYLSHHPYLPNSINRNKLSQAYSDKNSLPLAEFIQYYLHCWAGAELLVKHSVLKDPFFIFNLDLVEKLFPNATIIHIIRDPRATVASQIVRWPHLSAIECAMLWRDALRAANKWRQSSKLPYIEVYYEQLVGQTTKTLKNLCLALDIPYQASMQTFEQETTVFSPNAKPQKRTLTAVDISRLHGWQNHLTSSEIQLTEQICHLEMSQRQYQLSFSPNPIRHFHWWKMWQYSMYYVKQAGKMVKTFARQVRWHNRYK
ncbi:MAG: sulfotransferase [Chloroflexi bacterium]|nr:sulfotransferase [Chloroflexota bacterium]